MYAPLSPGARPWSDPEREARHYRALEGTRCWDAEVERVFRETGEPAVDAALQSREELAALAAFAEARGLRSYLELGLWTGRTLGALHALLGFEKLAGCDDGYPARFGLRLSVPPGTRLYLGNCRDPAYLEFRRSLGRVDLVLVDADHGYRGVRRDFERERALPHRFLAFHDITGANPATRGVARFWRELREGHKLEILRPHAALGLDHSVMGIGIWWA